MRALDRLRVRPRTLEIHERASIGRHVLGPQHLHRLERFVHPAPAFFEGDAEGFVFLALPTDSHPEVEATAAQAIEVRDVFGEIGGVALGNDADPGSEADA